MDEKRPLLNRESFVIRIWQREINSGKWVGEAQHVGSGETAVIRNLDELTNIVKKLLGEPAVPETKSTPVPCKNLDRNGFLRVERGGVTFLWGTVDPVRLRIESQNFTKSV